jgi:hypothetical protein
MSAVSGDFPSDSSTFSEDFFSDESVLEDLPPLTEADIVAFQCVLMGSMDTEYDLRTGPVTRLYLKGRWTDVARIRVGALLHNINGDREKIGLEPLPLPKPGSEKLMFEYTDSGQVTHSASKAVLAWARDLNEIYACYFQRLLEAAKATGVRRERIR